MGAVINVDFDEPRGGLIVTGEIEALARAPLVAAFLRSSHAVHNSQDEILIPTAKVDVQGTYQSLCRIVGRYGAVVTDRACLSQEMQRIRREADQFDDFSNKAVAIWQGRFDIDEFSKFVQVVERSCPGRTLSRLQLVSAYHLAFSQHTCNFSVPGAGKTSIVYGAYAYLNSLGSNDPKFVNHLLVAGPLSSFKAWEDEYRNIFGRAVVRKRLLGTVPDAERQSYLRGTASESFSTELTLTSYQTLAILEESFKVFFGFPQRKVMFVLDEAHNVKRPDGVWAGAALRLARQAASRIILTGTPAPNGYEDLENLFEFIHPGRRIVGYSGAALKSMTVGKLANRVDDLRMRIRPFYTRIRKHELELPPFSEKSVQIPLEGTHGQIYRYIERLAISSLRGSRDTFKSRLAYARLVRLRQAATNPSLLLGPVFDDEGAIVEAGAFSAPDLEFLQLVQTFDPVLRFGKTKLLERLIDDLFIRHRKILIWSVFVSNLTLIAECLRGKAEHIDIISGATPVNTDSDLVEDQDIETRERIIDRFLSSDRNAILIANPQAVGESISLHKSCHVAVYFDRDFNAGRFMQSKDRIHRYGLPRDRFTEYYYLTVEGTIDDDINTRLALKEQRLLRLIEQDDIPLFRIALGEDEDRDDIRQVLDSYERRKVQ